MEAELKEDRKADDGCLLAWTKSLVTVLREGGTERLLGEKILNYVGMLLLVLGGAFFLKYTAGLYGPWMKILTGLSAGVGLVTAGETLRRQKKFDLFSVPVIGGGWILLYYTSYAAHYIAASRVLYDPRLGFSILVAAASGMILHSLRVRSRWLTSFSFGTAFFVFFLTNGGVETLTVCGILAVSAAYLVRPLKSPELAAVSLAGFYLNYFPVFQGVLAASPAGGYPAADFWYGLGVLTAVQAVLLWRTPVAGNERDKRSLDICLSLSAILYAAMTYAQITSFGPAGAVAALLAVAGILASLSVVRGSDNDGAAFTSVSTLLSAAVTFLALIKIVPLPQQFWGFALAASVFGSVGVWLDRRSFQRYGLGLAAVNALIYVAHLGAFPPIKVVIGSSLLFLGIAAYAFAGLRERAHRKAEGLSGCWLYCGMLYVLLALATWFEPAAFVVAVLAFSILLDGVAGEYAAVPLYHQALLLQVFGGLYSFLIDYGSNLPVLGSLTPRMLVTAVLTLTYAALSFFREKKLEGVILGIPAAHVRRILPWMMTAVAAYGVYHEFGPRLRLPLWSLSALALLWTGRQRGEFSSDLRAMAYLTTCGTAAEGILSYLLYPEGLLEALGWVNATIYCGSAAMMLAPLAFPQWARDRAEEIEAAAAEHAFSALSLLLLALFIGKEAHDFYVTLGCSLAGAAYLFAGLYADKQALRFPGLGLLCACALKALFLDLAGLPLPYRVLSYTVLGGLLVLSSYVYVRMTKEGVSDAA